MSNLSLIKTDYDRQGFSLIEVLIFVTVFSLFFVMAASVVTTSLRITKENQNKIRATHYAEDLKEWIEAEREINWGGTLCQSCVITNNSSFTERVTQSQPGATTFCFNEVSLSAWPATGANNCYMTMDGQYRRIATFSATAVDGFVNQVGISISVEWKEGAQTKTVPLQTAFSIWE